MEPKDISLNETYIFSLGQHREMLKDSSTHYDSPSDEFHKKYPMWGDVEGLEVIILAKSSQKVMRFHVVGDPASCWAVANSDFFTPTGRGNISSLPPCTCNLWLGGCTCGVIHAERRILPPKTKKWRYLSPEEYTDPIELIF